MFVVLEISNDTEAAEFPTNFTVLRTVDQFAYIEKSTENSVRRLRSFLLTILLISSLASGCLSDSVDGQEVFLVVEQERTNGTIVESYSNGELVSSTSVFLEFDFSKTVSNETLKTFGIDPGDGRSPITVDPSKTNTINAEFSNHGIYEVIAYAVDEHAQRVEIQIMVLIELRIEWLESSTYEPKALTIDPIPMNGGESPESIIIDSTVENPVLVENLGGGREVEITWRLLDPQEDTCQSRKGTVPEGESTNWKTIHFNTDEIHELTLSYDEGQDEIDVNHIISIEYSLPKSESGS